ncbi:C4-dicarboxylate ABC transporter permease [Synergistales bacterium]|nr:C4-dicarboxylate ABC transporter permease [Synergistales bacterium]
MYDKFFKFLDSFEDYFLSISLFLMLSLTFAEVISRYVLHLSMAFAEEVTINLFVWSVMVGAASAVKHGHHIGFTLITDVLPQSWRRVVMLFVAMVCIGILLVIVWYGCVMTMSQMYYNQKTPALEWPEWVMGLSVPVGGILCIFRFLQAARQNWRAEVTR